VVELKMASQIDIDEIKIANGFLSEDVIDRDDLIDHSDYKQAEEYEYPVEKLMDDVLMPTDDTRSKSPISDIISYEEDLIDEDNNPVDDNNPVEDNEVVNGGIPIYLQGGKLGKIISGGATTWVMNDLDINLGLVDTNTDNTNEVSSIKMDNQIKYSFKLNNMDELDEWLASSEIDFLAKCLRKFKFHFVYSNALKGLFFDIVHLFEKYVDQILSNMYGGDESKISDKKKQWVDFDTANNLESSSVILYQFGKDEELNKFIESKSLNLFKYIVDKDRWLYLGWCPHVPDIRYRALLNFPLELMVDYLGVQLDILKLSNDFNQLKKIEAPSVSKETIAKISISDIKKKSTKEKSDELHNRIKSIESSLKEWEGYYSKCAAQVLDIAKIWQANFKEFGIQ